MSEDKIRVGIVGCGRTGAQTSPALLNDLGPNWLPLSHADAVKAIPEFSLVACCDLDRGIAAATAARYGARLVYTDYSVMLREAELDVLCVATRGDVRSEILCAAAEAGIRGVHCEKPLAHSVALARKAAQAIDGAGIAFSYGTLRTYMPVFQRARTVARGGDLGALQCVTVKFGRTGLLWNHPHSIGLVCMLCGGHEVDFVQASLRFDKALASKKLIDADPLVLSATIGFPGNITGHILDQGGWAVDVAGSEKALCIVCDGGWSIETDFSSGTNGDPLKRWRYARDETEASGRVRALLELRDAILLGAPTTVSATDAFEQHRILFALVQSDLEGGRRVRVDDVDQHLLVTGRTNGRVA
jgi:scyllo-inositol 2-dehydrogenase (NAD+)